MPEQVQCTIFSATMPLEVLEVTQKFMRDPIRILVKKDELTLEGTLCFMWLVNVDEKWCVFERIKRVNSSLIPWSLTACSLVLCV